MTLKATGPGLVHKTEVGGVRLDLRTDDEVRDAFASMRQSIGPGMTGAVVQPMIHGAVETIVGFAVDPAFGPQVLFGLGGTAVELLGDHQTRLTPLTDLDARDMVLGLRALPCSTGYRGSDSGRHRRPGRPRPARRPPGRRPARTDRGRLQSGHGHAERRHGRRRPAAAIDSTARRSRRRSASPMTDPPSDGA